MDITIYNTQGHLVKSNFNFSITFMSSTLSSFKSVKFPLTNEHFATSFVFKINPNEKSKVKT